MQGENRSSRTLAFAERCKIFGYDPNNIISKHVLDVTYYCENADRNAKKTIVANVYLIRFRKHHKHAA